jgi:hypothetical protein
MNMSLPIAITIGIVAAASGMLAIAIAFIAGHVIGSGRPVWPGGQRPAANP